MPHSLGVPGQPEHPKVVQAIAEAAQRARSRDVAVGVFSRTAAGASNWIGQGPTFLAVSEDTLAILDAVTAVRDSIGDKP
jgi:4-hydroxy-2-oxoheptanedioate aldolase